MKSSILRRLKCREVRRKRGAMHPMESSQSSDREEIGFTRVECECHQLLVGLGLISKCISAPENAAARPNGVLCRQISQAAYWMEFLLQTPSNIGAHAKSICLRNGQPLYLAKIICKSFRSSSSHGTAAPMDTVAYLPQWRRLPRGRCFQMFFSQFQ